MKLSAYGISIRLPEGWEGKIYRRRHGDPTLHAANFRLPERDGDFGSGAVRSMGDGGIFVALTEYRRETADGALFAFQGLPLPLRGSDLDRRAFQRLLPGRAGVQRFFTAASRPFCLYVAVGHEPGRPRLLRRANEVLSTLAISPAANPR
jgi:hypothetical protein